MNISFPYLLFLGDSTDVLSIKMAKGPADWSPEKCIAEYRVEGCTVSTGLPQMNIAQAVENGAKSFVLGMANSGGILDPKWVPYIIEALKNGLDIVSGLHQKLADNADIAATAKQYNRQLFDIRHPTQKLTTGTGIKRTGKRILTVGTDCSVGKMYASLSLTKEMQQRGLNVDFRATGQTGILIKGEGIAIDCVVADFISGATESLSPNNQHDHWDIIEGQGSLSHPAFAGVSLGLLHGSQPDGLIICHALNRTHMRGIEQSAFPSISETIALNLTAAKLTNPEAKVLGIAINTSSVSEDEAKKLCEELSKEFAVPCIDPIRHTSKAIVDNMNELQLL